VNSRLNGSSEIARVASAASSAKLAQTFMQTVNVKKYSTVHFHAYLIRSMSRAGVHTVGLRVYDGRDALVYESITPVQFEIGNNRFSIDWMVSDESGFAQEVGFYTAVLWIDNSKAFEYAFVLEAKSSTASDSWILGGSGLGSALSGLGKKKKTESDQSEDYGGYDVPYKKPTRISPEVAREYEEEIKTLERKMKIPKVWLVNLLVLIAYIVFLNVSYVYGMTAVYAVSFIFLGFAGFLIYLNKRFVTKRWLWAVLLVFPLFISGGIWLAVMAIYIFYGIWLAVMAIYVKCSEMKWRERIAFLKMEISNKLPE
jgi:hypothetical protein